MAGKVQVIVGDVFTLAQAAQYLGLSSKTVRELAVKQGAGHIPCRQVGRQWRFHRRSLEHWLRAPKAQK